ncbi:uncharacterized protein LOC135836486 [Planococcus citri]|uniref:uncharacterized protein LOC135836486 n=1 Tax=Planococcus citri TaxID=170843 RepID=UPI0031F857D2
MMTVPKEAIRRQIITLIPVYMNVFLMGCADGWLPNAVYFFLVDDEVRTSSSKFPLITLVFSDLGKIVFAIPAGILVDKYGRKNISLWVAISTFFAWFGLSLSSSLVALYTARFVLGLAEAMIYSSSLVSIGEIASPEIRGQLTNIGLIFINAGLILPSIVSVIFGSYKSLAWGITFFSILNLLSMIWAVETPSYLVSVSKLKQAKNNLQEIRKGYNVNDIDTEFEKLHKYIDDEKNRRSKLTWVKFIKSKAIRKPLLIGILLNVITVFIGSSLIKVYITVIIPSNELVPKKYYPLIIQALLLLISFFTTFYVDKFPRRSIFLFGAISVLIINAICALANYIDIENDQYQSTANVFKWIFIFGNLLNMICYNAAIQPMNTALKAELYPQTMKGFCGSVTVICHAVATIILYQLYDFVKDYLELSLAYIMFSINSLLLILAVYFFAPEGRGASLTDLQMKFKESQRCCRNDEENLRK